MRGLGLLWLVAACHPNGLTIDVVIDDPNIKKVELFAGDSCYADCPRGTVPPGLPPMALDAAFIVSDPQPFTVVEQDFTDGVAGFRLESPQDAYVAILVAVGYDAQNQIRWSWSKHDVTIPDHDSERWQIHLEPTTPIQAVTLPPPVGTERHKDWPDPAGHPSCLLLEHWSDSPQPFRELIAPTDDTDCDGIPAANECAPWIPNAVAAPPTLDTANCVVAEMSSDGTSICMIGGPVCNETGTLPPDSCVPLVTPHCAPSSLCQCAGPDAAACLRMQIANGTSQTTVMPYLKCLIRVDANWERCDTGQLKIDAGAFLQGSRKCKGLQLNEDDMPLGSFSDALHVGNAKLKLDSFVEPCKIDATWVPGMAPPETFGFFDAELDNGYHLTVPARIEVRPGCVANATSTCVVVPTSQQAETMFNCAAAPPMVTCVADSSGTCPGPMCGSDCCGPGEACTPNGCTCGGGPSCSGGNTCQTSTFNDNRCGAICCGATTLCPL